jgi:dihydropteroate synthase
MADLAVYRDVVTDVLDELTSRVAAAEAAGIPRSRLVIDPGLGFAKEPRHNWELLRALPEFVGSGLPVLIGASRKRFLGALLADASGQPRDLADRDHATDAVTAIAAHAGVWAVRVHDVAGSSDAVRVAEAWSSGDDPHQRRTDG